MTLVVLGHYRCAQHDMGDDHPESPARLHAISDQLIASGVEFVVRSVDANPVLKEHLCRVHDQSYVDDMYGKSPSEGQVWLDDDTLMMPRTLLAAQYAAGAGVDAVDLVMKGDIDQVFCAVRPPGHHAERNKAMGFCLFNNVAVAAAYALDHYQLDRVAIIDFDVHHGNGTQDIFNDDKRVLFCSSFQHPFYPLDTDITGNEHILNLPLPAGTGGDEFRAQVSEQWLSALRDFKPQLILISAGFDAHIEDDLSQLKLTESDYAWITGELKKIANESCSGKIVSVLEGGYALSALGRSVVAHIKALMD